VCLCTADQWELNGNSSKMVKVTDFKFVTRFQGQSGHDLQKFSEKGALPGSRDPLHFWALNAYSSKMRKHTEFKFDKCVRNDSPDMTPKKFPKRRRGQGDMTHLIFGR